MKLEDLSKKDWVQLRKYIEVNVNKYNRDELFIFGGIERAYLGSYIPIDGYTHQCLKEAFEVPFSDIPLWFNSAILFTKAVYLFRLNSGL